MNAQNALRRLALFGGVICVLGLSGCGGHLADLQQYANEVKARKGGHIEPPPQIKPFPTYAYADQDMTSPFMPQTGNNTTTPSMVGVSTNGIHPDTTRSREYLEQFPLDGLKMVGTLTVAGTLYGLVKDSGNIVTRVKLGNYMGQNYGKIVGITDTDIKLREIVPDGQGGWVERITDVALAD